MKRIIHLLVALSLWLQIGCGTEHGAATTGSESQEVGVQANTDFLEDRDIDSARRDPKRDWREYAQNYRRDLAARGLALAAATVLDSKVAAASANFANVPVWSEVDIKMQFRALRDVRFMYGSSNPTVVRRCSWLYPDDGCFARAELVTSMAGDNGKPKPYKLFSFGNLVVQTTNSPSGQVSWWYHVVPVVKSASTGVVYVLDPAIDSSRPLEWQAWLLRQVSALNQVEVTVADPNAYVPSSPVTGGASQTTQALSAQQTQYLNLEWTRQVALARDPTRVLGDDPPWGREKIFFVDADLLVPACQTCRGADALSLRCARDCP